MAMVVECWIGGERAPRLAATHRASDELTAAEVLKRLGLTGSRYRVVWYPEGRPDQAKTIYRPENP